MRLRYPAFDYFQDASRSSREQYFRHMISLPTVTSLEQAFDALSKSDGFDHSDRRSLFDSSSPKMSFEFPRDFPWVGETIIRDKFLSEIFPSTVPCQISIDLGEVAINTLESVNWMCSEMRQIKVQVQKEDDNRILREPQTVDPSEIIHEAIPESTISDKIPHLSTFGQQGKELKPISFASEFQNIELPQLELWDCVPQPAWFDISPLPCSTERWKNKWTATEENCRRIHHPWKAIFEDIRYSGKMNNLIAKILPIEIRMIPENLNLPNKSDNEMSYPLKPTCLLQWFESHERTMERLAENLPLGGFNTKMTLEDSLRSKLVKLEGHTQRVKLLPGFLCDHCDLRPSSAYVMKSATDRLHGVKLTFEIPNTCDWSLSSLASTTLGIIAAHESETPAPDFPRLHPSYSFESAVVIPELSLDDQQFQFLPVPMVTSPKEYMIDAQLRRLVSLNCEPCTLPATDWLYLDWHFLHGLKCTNAVCFSLKAQLIEKAQCSPLPSTSLTTDVLKKQQFSKQVLELRLLEDDGFHQGSGVIPHDRGTRGETIEAFQKGGKLSCQPCVEIRTPHKRENESLPQTPYELTTDIDRILPACYASNLTQINHTCGEEDGTMDREVQATKYDPEPSRLRSFLLQSPVERLRNSKSIHNEGGHFDRKCKPEKPSNDPGYRKDMRSTFVQNGSDSMANDFDFFVRARKGLPVTGSDLQTIKDAQENSVTVVDELTLSPTFDAGEQDNSSTEAVVFCEHKVELSADIRKCMVSLSSDYSALLAMDEISELKSPGDLKTLKEFGFEAHGNSYVTSLISSMADEPVSRERQTVLRALIGLHVLRHTALNLCNYGIQVGHLYLENCFESMQFLEAYIISSRTELEEVYDQVQRGIVEDHPKLSCLDKLLGSVALETHQAKYLSTRILLLADRRAFFSLVRKLVSLGLAPYQIDRKENYLYNGVLREDCLDKLKDELSEALTFSNCLLVSYAYLNPSFPVQKFTIIIQYADPPDTNSTIDSWTKERYVVHSFKVLVHPEKFQMKRASSSCQQTDSQDPQEHSLSGSTPLYKPPASSADQSLSESSSLNQNVPASAHERTTHSSSKQCSSERRELIIVANISHPNDHLLTGRRSSYQKILHLEKENLQVIERELRLPVDLILSPAFCIVIYTLRKLNLEPQNLKENQETLKNEVLTHLKAISFSFRDCIMIFEGPTEFTTAALEISSLIYSLAIALDIQFQCFASRHPDVTDSILMHSIQSVRKSKHMPSYPIMTEGPTLAEVFLTGFPSINPLTAHAILSSGCSLPLFLSYAPEEQYAAIEPFEVPKHCLELFKIQCTFKAIATTGAVSDCRGVAAPTNQPDVGRPYQHLADSGVLYVDVSNPASTPEVWESFPEFPPASAITEDSPTCSAHDVNSNNSFPDFPPISEINSQTEDPDDNEPSSSDLYEFIDIHPPVEIASWPLHRSQKDNGCLYEGLLRKNNAQEMYAQDDIQWFSKGAGSAKFGSDKLEDTFRIPRNPPPTRNESQDHCLQLEKRQQPWLMSAPANGSKRLGDPPESLHGEYEILQNSRPAIPRPRLEVKRSASRFSSISPTVYGGQQETGLNNALGSWNDHKRVRGVTSEFMADTFNLEDIDDGHFVTRSATGPNSIDELSPVRPAWIDNSASVHEETNLDSRRRQSKRPQATLKASSLDRFRYQGSRPAPATTSNNYTQTTIKFPTVKLPRTAPRGSRTQSPSVPSLPPLAGKSRSVQKISCEFTGDRRPRAILGIARRGSDTQQRLVWNINPSSSCAKRRKMS